MLSTGRTPRSDEELLGTIDFAQRYRLEADGRYRSIKHHTDLPLTKEQLAGLLRRAYEHFNTHGSDEVLLTPEALRAYLVDKGPLGTRLHLVEADDDVVLGQGANGLVLPARDYSSGAPRAIKLATRPGALQKAYQSISRLDDALRRDAAALQEAFPDAYSSKGGRLKATPCVLMDRPLLLAGATELHMRRYWPLDYDGMTAAQRCAAAHDITTAMLLLHRAGFVFADLKPANTMRRADGRTVLIDLDGVVALADEPPAELMRSLFYGDPCAEEQRNLLHILLLGLAADKAGIEKQVRWIVAPVNAALAQRMLQALREIGDAAAAGARCRALVNEELRRCLVDIHYYCWATMLTCLFVPKLLSLTDEELTPYACYLRAPWPQDDAPAVGLDWPALFEEVVREQDAFKALPQPLQEALAALFSSDEPRPQQAQRLPALLQGLAAAAPMSAAAPQSTG